MRKIFFALLFYLSAFAEAQTKFQNVYTINGHSGIKQTNDVKQTFDNGYILTGLSQTYAGGGGSIYLIKTNVNGDTLWSHLFGDSLDWSFGHDVIQTYDQGYAIVGTTLMGAIGNEDILLIKTDSFGDTLWTKMFGTALDDRGRQIIQSGDGGFVIGGTTFNAGFWDMFLLKADSSGNIVWLKSYGTWDSLMFNYNTEELYALQRTTSGGYILAGRIHYQNKIYLVETDSLGNLLWSKVYPMSLTGGISLRSLNDGFLVCFEHYLAKIDLTGNIIWVRSYFEYPIEAVQTTDGNFVWLHTNGLTKIDSAGNILWCRKIDDTNMFSAQTFESTNDSAFVILEITNQVFSDKIGILKTDSSGNAFCNSTSSVTIFNPPVMSFWDPYTMITNVPFTSSNPDIKTYACPLTVNDCSSFSLLMEQNNTSGIIKFSPNPFHSSTTLVVTNEGLKIQNCILRVYNSMGALVRLEQIPNITPDSYRDYILHRHGLSEGLYFYELRSNNSELLSNGKFVIE